MDKLKGEIMKFKIKEEKGYFYLYEWDQPNRNCAGKWVLFPDQFNSERAAENTINYLMG